MRILHRRCAGVDVHKRPVSVCIRIRRSGASKTEVLSRVFATFTEDLERMRDWLREHKVCDVAMESTGVYWIPVWNVLERGNENWFRLILVNPLHVRALPGRKTDQQDGERIAELQLYGRLRSSFIPPRDIRLLRDLTRARTHAQQDRNRVINRIGRLLETANCKLGSVASDLTVKTSMAILRALGDGQGNPERMADLAMAAARLRRRILSAR
jgi:transposase